MANRAILRERHPSPTVDDLIHSLNGATVFSKLDLRSGYHQLSLASESRYITTFATHKGLRRYKRLNFGTNSASEIFQNAINEQVRDIQGVINISDDIIVFGETQEKHDEALEAVLRRLLSVGLTVNKKNANLTKSHLNFSDLSSQERAFLQILERSRQYKKQNRHHQPQKYEVLSAWQPTVPSLFQISVTLQSHYGS